MARTRKGLDANVVAIIDTALRSSPISEAVRQDVLQRIMNPVQVFPE